MNNLNRFTVCKVTGHKWLTIGYPAGADGESSGTFLRCRDSTKSTQTVARH